MLENMLINYAGKVIKSLTTTNSHEKMNEVPQRAPFDTIPTLLSSSSQESRKWRKRWLVIVHSGVLTTNRVHPLWAINRGIMIAQQALAHNGDSSFKATNYSEAVGWFLFWKFLEIICFLKFSFHSKVELLKRTYIKVLCLCHRNLAEQLPRSQTENVIISMHMGNVIYKNLDLRQKNKTEFCNLSEL